MFSALQQSECSRRFLQIYLKIGTGVRLAPTQPETNVRVCSFSSEFCAGIWIPSTQIPPPKKHLEANKNIRQLLGTKLNEHACQNLTVYLPKTA